jgi:hypothetical protein
MNRQEVVNRWIRLALVASLFMFFLVFATPNAVPGPIWGFFKVAGSASWHRFFDWPAAWCSLKILLLSVGIFLMFDALGTIADRASHRALANMFFFSTVLPAVGFLVGNYYLVKALL